MAAESTQKFKSTNFYRIIKSFVSVRNDAYTSREQDEGKCLARLLGNSKTTFSTFSIFICSYCNGSAKKL